MKHSATQHLEDLKQKGRASLFPAAPKILVGASSCGLAAGAAEVFATIAGELKKTRVATVLQKTGCIGMCYLEPLVDVVAFGRPRLSYAGVTPKLAAQLVADLKKGRVTPGAVAKFTAEPFLLDDTTFRYGTEMSDFDSECIPDINDMPFYQKQFRIALRNCGFIDPENIAEYIAKGGYGALADALHSRTPRQIINEVERSGLRGRGGAGFPTGLKWNVCRRARESEKYIVCNADEGDPGAYMDRSILEGDPHTVIEGMLIAGFAIGASRGYVYIRDEYPLAIERLEVALAQAKSAHLLGNDILQSGFCFDITISRGAGAFVCGEETALLQSIEGNCGEPGQRPPYPAERGLRGKPTVINNVETLATVPAVISRGAPWFASLGTATSKGTKVFSLVGNISRTGLVEVPMGTPLRDIIEEIGGGVPGNKRFKAVQTGGPSGGCIPAGLIDLPVDYDALAQTGSIMGSGGMIVMDETACMVDIARYFLEFLEQESCGKCVPCRVGIKRMREILSAVCEGTAALEDLALLEKTAGLVKSASLCGLGKTAPNPVLSTLKHFRDEYLAHILTKSCPAGVCKALLAYTIDRRACTGCGACKKACPADAITGTAKKAHVINRKKCIACGACRELCPAGAVLTAARTATMPAPAAGKPRKRA